LRLLKSGYSRKKGRVVDQPLLSFSVLVIQWRYIAAVLIARSAFSPACGRLCNCWSVRPDGLFDS
jgi:hypothetical protein